jgi:hypothetical protein
MHILYRDATNFYFFKGTNKNCPWGCFPVVVPPRYLQLTFRKGVPFKDDFATLISKRNPNAVSLSAILSLVKKECINHVVGFHSACGIHFAFYTRRMLKHHYPD